MKWELAQVTVWKEPGVSDVASEARLQAVLEHAPVVLLALDLAGTITLAEGRDRSALEIPLRDLVGRSASEVYTSPAAREILRRASAGEVTAGTLVLGGVTYDVRTSPVRDAAGERTGTIVVATDISERARALARLEARAEQQAAVARLGQLALDGLDLGELMGQAVAACTEVLDVETVAVLEAGIGVGARMVAGAGWPGDAVIGPALPAELASGELLVIEDLATDPRFPAPSPLHELGVTAALCAPLARGQGQRASLAAFRRDARPFASEERDFLQAMASVIGAAFQRRQAEELVRYQSLHDDLTGLPNRTLLKDRLERALSLARRDGHLVGLLLLDLDDFKQVNDTLGHDVGDLLLQQVAARLCTALRDADTVARLGGDEFAILLVGMSDATQLELVARKVQRAVGAPVAVAETRLAVRASVGMALGPLHGEEASGVLKRADIAMYRAKRAGLGHALYDPAHDEHSLQELTAVNELREGIERGELVVHYQPKVDLRTGEVTRLEALVRWQHPRRGLLPAAAVVPLAERTGLIGALTAFVLDASLAQLAAWRAEGLDLNVEVNLSVRTLHDAQLPALVATALARSGLPPEALALEVTETAVMVDPVLALKSLAALDALGVELALDDFGTGYSSLAQLQRLPLHGLKIDRSFVWALAAGNDRAGVIVRTIIELAHGLGLEVIGEGVEDAGVLARLRELGCDLAQGFEISVPLPAAELGAWLRARELV